MKKNNYIRFFVGFGIFMLSIGPLISQKQKLPHERVSLVTDRDLYISGETIWFTASCFLENGDGPSPLSQILYVELFNANRKIFVQEKFKLTNGRVSANLHIPDELPTSNYFIRGYTMYLRNFPPESYFTSSLIIINPEFPIKQEILLDGIELYLQQGKLISGVPNQLTIRFPASKAPDIEGFVLADTNGTKISPVKFYQNGLAICSFVPNDSSLYKVRMVMQNKDTIDSLLPRPEKSGFVVQTALNSQQLVYKLSGSLPDMPLSDSISITIRSQEFAILYNEKTTIENLKKGISTPINELSPGLNYIELRTSASALLNLQTVFIENPEINISINTSKETFQPREKVEIEINTKGLEHHEIEFLQVSVVKKRTRPIISENLQMMMMINPQLLRDAENIEFNPEIYDQIEAALQIYSHRIQNNYQTAISSIAPNFDYIPDIRDISIMGLVQDKKSREPVAGVRLYASVMHDEFQLHTTQSSTDGRFAFSLPYLEGKYDVFLCPEYDTLTKVEILLKNDFSSQFTALLDCPPDLDDSDREFLEEVLLNWQVSANFSLPNEVFSQPPVKLPAWFGDDLNSIELKKYIALTSIQEVFNEIVPFVKLKEKNGQFKLHVYDDQSQVYCEDPLVLLDGIPITNINILLQLYPAQVDRIEVLNRTFILGNLTIRGLVSVRTKTDNFGGVQLPEDVVFVNYQTRSVLAEFNPINLETDTTLQPSMPFFKNLLYFNSFHSIDEIPERISFYTSDHLSEYEIIIRGKTLDGGWIIGRNEFRVVEK